MDGQLFRRPFRGVRSFGFGDDDVRRRIEEAALLLPPGGAVGGWAAAAVHEFPFSDGEHPDGSLRRVPVLVPRDAQIRVRPGLRVVRGLLRPGDTTVVAGLAVTTAVRTAFDEVRTADDPGWALARADVALRSGKVSAAALCTITDTRPGWRGVVQARRVAPLAVATSESPWESRLRWHWLDEVEVHPHVNEDLFTVTGEWLGRVDLLDEEAGVVGEFDGSDHGRPGQRAADLERDERLRAAGLRVVRFTSEHVTGRGWLARARIREAYRQAARPVRPRRWTIHPR